MVRGGGCYDEGVRSDCGLNRTRLRQIGAGICGARTARIVRAWRIFTDGIYPRFAYGITSIG